MNRSPKPVRRNRPAFMPLYNQKKIAALKPIYTSHKRSHIPLWQILQWGRIRFKSHYPKIYDRSLWFKSVWDDGITKIYYEDWALKMRKYDVCVRFLINAD